MKHNQSNQLFIRFGEIPKSERSSIHFHGIHVGYEIGVSVYYGVKINDRWHVVYPNPSNENTACTLQNFLGGQGPGAPNSNQKVYLVSGDVTGIGCDGEPLIKNVMIIEDLTDNFIYDANDDKAKELANTIDPKTGKTMYELGCQKIL